MSAHDPSLRTAVETDLPASPRVLVDWLVAHGRHWVTIGEVAELLGIPRRHVPQTLRRLRDNGSLVSPTRGAYVPVPPEFRAWGSPPASHFIDPMMHQLGHPYYVGLLSAAEVHGVAHQRPQVFQVLTPARLAERSLGRVRLEFVHATNIEGRPTSTINTPTGTMIVSTPETTALDLVSRPRRAGGISNVATVIAEMLEEGLLDGAYLGTAARHYPVAAAQRLGWLASFLTSDGVANTLDLTELSQIARTRRDPTLLVASGPRDGVYDGDWHLLVNADVERDR